VQSGKLRAVCKPEAADAFFIVVPTPFKQNHRADITYVEAATRSVIPYLQEGNLFVIESTSPVYTTERMAEVIYKERPELKGKIHIAYCPERVLPGNTLYELVHNDRVIGGIDPASTAKVIEFYSAFVQGKLHGTNARTAEMCKLTENSSRDSQIAFANELSMICDKAGINVWELIELANKHPRVNILQPGCGVGGHCIAVDPWFIVSDYPEQAQLIKRARETNDYKADWCANKVLETCQKFVEQWQCKEDIVANQPDDNIRFLVCFPIVCQMEALMSAYIRLDNQHVRSRFGDDARGDIFGGRFPQVIDIRFESQSHAGNDRFALVLFKDIARFRYPSRSDKDGSACKGAPERYRTF